MITVKKLLKIIDKDNKKKLLFLIPLLIIVSFIEILGIALVLPVISLIVNPIQSGVFINSFLINFINVNSSEDLLIIFILALLFIFSIKYIFLIFFYYFQNKVAFNLMHEITTKLYKSYLNKDYKFYINNNSSHIISNLSTQLPDTIYNFVQPLLILISEIFVITIIFIVVFFRL